MKRKLTALLALLICISMIMAIPASAATQDEINAKKVATTFLYGVKTYNVNKIKSTMAPTKYGTNLEYITNAYVVKPLRVIQKKYFKYKITNVKVNGSKATVTANVSFFDGFYLAKAAAYATTLYYTIRLQTPNDKQVGQKFYYYLCKNYKKRIANHVYSTKSVIQLQKINGKWKIVKPNTLMKWYIDARFVVGIDDYDDELNLMS